MNRFVVGRVVCTFLSFALLATRPLFGDEPFRFITSYDGGITSETTRIGCIGTTHQMDRIIVGSLDVTAIVELQLLEESKELKTIFALQNFWSAKECAVPQAETTNVPIASPYSCLISSDGRYFYTNGIGGRVFPQTYARDVKSGKLTPISLDQEQIRAGAGLPPAQHLATSPDGHSIYAAAHHTLLGFERNAETGKLKLLQIIEDDSKGVPMIGEEKIQFHKIPGADLVKKLRYVEDVHVSPDGRFVYAVSFDEMAVTTFSRDPKTGRLTFVESVFNELEMGRWKGIRKGLEFAYRLTISGDGQSLYVATSGRAVVVFLRDKETGKLTYLQTIENDPFRPERNPNYIAALHGCADVCVSPDGKQVYVACLDTDAIVVFARDEKLDGKLTFLDTLTEKTLPGSRLRNVAKLCTTRDGKYLLAMSRDALVNVIRRTDLK